MMKSVISEVLQIELIKLYLSEGRVEDTIKKYPQDTAVVDYFSKNDPSGNNKYLAWMMKIYKDLASTNPDLLNAHKELIATLIKGFHQHSARLQQKDINQYKTLADLHNVINPLIKSAEEKTAQKEKIEKGVIRLYEDEDWLFIQPLEHETSCKYGANTKWCIAAKNNPGHFKNYTETGVLLFLIHKQSNNKFAFYIPLDESDDLNYQFEHPEIYNPKDYNLVYNEDYGDEGIIDDLEEFFAGLVNGEMTSYLEHTEEGDYDDDDYTLYKVRPDGSLVNVGEYYEDDLDDLISDLHDIIYTHLYKNRNINKSVDEAKKGFNIVGLDLTPKYNRKGEITSFKVHKIGKNKTYFNIENYNPNFTWDEIVYNTMYEEIDSLSIEEIQQDVLLRNNLPFIIRGPGLDETPKKEEPKKKKEKESVMSKQQASNILKVYNQVKDREIKEVSERAEKLFELIMPLVSLTDENKEILRRSMLETKGDGHHLLSNLRRMVGGNWMNFGVTWKNPTSNRNLKRTLGTLWQKYRSQISKVGMSTTDFSIELLRRLHDRYFKKQ